MGFVGVEAINMTLVFSTLFARHGIRSAYPPYGESRCNTYTKYSGRDFPTFEDWGMTEEQYCRQELTPHGKLVAPRVGEYYRSVLDSNKFAALKNFTYGCDTLAVFSDNSTRNIQTANLFVEGFGCKGRTEILIAGENEYANTVMPVVSDHDNTLSCPTASQAEFEGLFDSTPDLITESFRDRIALVDRVLQMKAYNATICSDANPDYDESLDGPCTMFQTGYQYTGLYFQGLATAPYNRAGFFAELFMLQYVSNLKDWAFGNMNLAELEFIFGLHVQNQAFNLQLNSAVYGSQSIGYLLASMEQSIQGDPVPGIVQGPDKNVLVFSTHDFNLGYIFGILGLEYIFEEAKAQRGVLFTTTGQIRFDLFQSDVDDEYYVRTTFTVASPTQMRNNVPLTVETPPQVLILGLQACGMQVFCPYNEFKEIALNAISIDCIQEPLRGTLQGMSKAASRDASSSSTKMVSAFVFLVSFVPYFLSF